MKKSVCCNMLESAIVKLKQNSNSFKKLEVYEISLAEKDIDDLSIACSYNTNILYADCYFLGINSSDELAKLFGALFAIKSLKSINFSYSLRNKDLKILEGLLENNFGIISLVISPHKSEKIEQLLLRNQFLFKEKIKKLEDFSSQKKSTKTQFALSFNVETRVKNSLEVSETLLEYIPKVMCDNIISDIKNINTSFYQHSEYNKLCKSIFGLDTIDNVPIFNSGFLDDILLALQENNYDVGYKNLALEFNLVLQESINKSDLSLNQGKIEKWLDNIALKGCYSFLIKASNFFSMQAILEKNNFLMAKDFYTKVESVKDEYGNVKDSLIYKKEYNKLVQSLVDTCKARFIVEKPEVQIVNEMSVSY